LLVQNRANNESFIKGIGTAAAKSGLLTSSDGKEAEVCRTIIQVDVIPNEE